MTARRCRFDMLKTSKLLAWSENAQVDFWLKYDAIATDRRITIGPRSCKLICRMPIRETMTEKSMSSSRSPRMVFMATQCCYRAGEMLNPGFRPVSGPSLHSPRFPGNQSVPSLLERRKMFIEGKPSRDYLSR
jgi:hypothetical protein